MTQYAIQGPVVGQPISPNFGAQNGAATPGNAVIQQPTTAPVTGGMQATGVQMSLLEACSRGIIPRNCYVASVAGVATAAGISNTNGDAMSVDEAMGDGNGAQVNLGVAVPGSSHTPAGVATAGVNNQEMVGGIAASASTLVAGPAAVNTETMTSGPTPASMTTANVSLVSNSFAG